MAAEMPPAVASVDTAAPQDAPEVPAPVELPVQSAAPVAEHASPAPMPDPLPERLPPQSAAPNAGQAARGYTATPEGDVWHAVVQQLAASEAITALVRELALQSQLVARDGGHWLLRVERASLNQSTARERLRAALEAAGHAQQISVEIGIVIDSPARRNAVAEQERQRVAQDIVMNDPFVQSMLQAHGAKIVPGSIKPL